MLLDFEFLVVIVLPWSIFFCPKESSSSKSKIVLSKNDSAINLIHFYCTGHPCLFVVTHIDSFFVLSGGAVLGDFKMNKGTQADCSQRPKRPVVLRASIEQMLEKEFNCHWQCKTDSLTTIQAEINSARFLDSFLVMLLTCIQKIKS